MEPSNVTVFHCIQHRKPWEIFCWVLQHLRVYLNVYLCFSLLAGSTLVCFHQVKTFQSQHLNPFFKWQEIPPCSFIF